MSAVCGDVTQPDTVYLIVSKLLRAGIGPHTQLLQGLAKEQYDLLGSAGIY